MIVYIIIKLGHFTNNKLMLNSIRTIGFDLSIEAYIHSIRKFIDLAD